MRSIFALSHCRQSVTHLDSEAHSRFYEECLVRDALQRSEDHLGRGSPLVAAEQVQQLVKRGVAGWLSTQRNAADVVNVAVAAGNAGKTARRSAARSSVQAADGWRALAHRLDEAGIDYAVSGLVAARRDRATARAMRPVIYVDDPSATVRRLDLTASMPGQGVLLLAPGYDELSDVEVDADIRFVSQAQGMLDAFAGAGREPDKAEDLLRAMLAASS